MESNPQPDDYSLVQRIALKDQMAMGILYDRYSRLIYTLAYRVLNSSEEAEEIVLDVFAQVWRICPDYDPKKSRVDTWLFMLTRSRALDRSRVLNRRQREMTAQKEAVAVRPSVTDTPENSLLMTERREQVRHALSLLPPEQRLAIELAYYQGLTHAQIANQTGQSLGTIKTRIRLGLGKLRQALQESK